MDIIERKLRAIPIHTLRTLSELVAENQLTPDTQDKFLRLIEIVAPAEDIPTLTAADQAIVAWTIEWLQTL